MRCTEKGQAIVEVALMIPFLLVLTLGIIELSNAIDTYMVLSELTREGASMTSRGTPADKSGPNNDAFDAIIAGGAPIIDAASPVKWKVVYSRIGPSNDPNNPNGCANTGTNYIVLERKERGAHSGTTQVGTLCGAALLPGIGAMGAGQSLHVIEVYYAYATITGLEHYGINVGASPFYRRSVF